MLMILARLQAIDSTLYEAAEVDGANTWQQFWNVTLPELRYVLGAIFFLRLMWTFNKFDDIFLLTGGGFGTKVLPILTVEFSFQTRDFGKGAATGMILLVMLVVFLLLYTRFVMRNVEEVSNESYQPLLRKTMSIIDRMVSSFTWKRFIFFTALFMFLSVIVFPFYWMISSSFKTRAEIGAREPVYLPESLNMDAYRELVRSQPS